MPNTRGDATARTLPRRSTGERAAWALSRRARLGVEALEDLRRRARRIQAPGDDLVEERAEALVLAQRLFELRAQARRAEREDLAAEVAPAALGQRPLRLDVGAM